MPQVVTLPYEFVNEMIDPGLTTTAGAVPLNQYMCSNRSNGDNDNTNSLFKNMRWFKDGGKGPTLDSLVGRDRMDILIKGQGRPDDYETVWNFMLRNKGQLDTYKVTVGHRPKSNREEFVFEKKGTVYDLYFDGRSDAQALQLMVKDRFFGIDCIGFVANYLIRVGIWTKYHGYEPKDWDKVFTENVSEVGDIEPLNLLLWNTHVALIDWVWDVVDDKTVRVDVCQSSSGGPQCNEYVYLERMNATTSKGYRKFKIVGGGSPKMPVDNPVSIMRMPGLFY